MPFPLLPPTPAATHTHPAYSFNIYDGFNLGHHRVFLGLPQLGCVHVPRPAISGTSRSSGSSGSSGSSCLGKQGSVSKSSVPMLASVDSCVSHSPDLISIWLLQVSGVHAPQPVTTQHYDPLWGHGLEAPILCISWHTALGNGEATVWLTLPAHEWKPGPGI